MFNVDRSEVKVGTVVAETKTHFVAVITGLDERLGQAHLMYSDGSVEVVSEDVLERDFYVLRFSGETEIISFRKQIGGIRKSLNMLENIICGKG